MFVLDILVEDIGLMCIDFMFDIMVIDYIMPIKDTTLMVVIELMEDITHKEDTIPVEDIIPLEDIDRNLGVKFLGLVEEIATDLKDINIVILFKEH
jgi:hypothetical protein